MNLSYRLGWLGFRLMYATYFRWRVFNPERVPRTGAVILASNHASFLDPPLVGSYLGRECWFLAREEILKVPGLGWLCRHLNAYPIRQGAGDREAIRACLAILRAGWPLVFFPEGTRTMTGTLGPIQGGFVMILDRLPGIPYVPIVLQDTHDALRRGWALPRPHKVRIRVGEPAFLPPRRAAENAREYYGRCAKELEMKWRELGAK